MVSVPQRSPSIIEGLSHAYFNPIKDFLLARLR
jgi:hypothetical protein